MNSARSAAWGRRSSKPMAARFCGCWSRRKVDRRPVHPDRGHGAYHCRTTLPDVSNEADSQAMQEPTDDALMSAYAAGDASALEALYARHQASLYRFIRRLLGPAMASQTDEVFQDTWLRVVHARAQWQPQGATFRTWLFTLANHRVIDLWRKSGREVSLDLDDAAGASWEPEGTAWQQWPAPASAAPHSEELAFWR